MMDVSYDRIPSVESVLHPSSRSACEYPTCFWDFCRNFRDRVTALRPRYIRVCQATELCAFKDSTSYPLREHFARALHLQKRKLYLSKTLLRSITTKKQQ